MFVGALVIEHVLLGRVLIYLWVVLLKNFITGSLARFSVCIVETTAAVQASQQMKTDLARAGVGIGPGDICAIIFFLNE